MISKAEISVWAEHPVTRQMLEFLKEDLKRIETSLHNYSMTCEHSEDMKVGFLRGKIDSAHSFIDLKDRMMELAEEHQLAIEENKDEEDIDSIPGIRT